MSRTLITGAQGLVGRYLTARLLELDPESQILGLGRSERADGVFTHAISIGGKEVRAPVPPTLQQLDGRYRYQAISLLATEKLRQAIGDFQPDCIFHLASALHSAKERDLFQTNLEGTASLLSAVAEAQGSKARVILGSSGSVYGEQASLPVAESHACVPVELYGVTKLAAEHIARVKAARGGCALITARIFNVVGPGQAESHVCGRFAAQLAAASRAGGATLSVGALDTTRDFIDVRDVASALALLALKGERGVTYNLGSGRETPVGLVLSELLRIAGLGDRIKVVQQGGLPAGVKRQVADISSLVKLGFVPAYSLAQSLEGLYRYYQTLLE